MKLKISRCCWFLSVWLLFGNMTACDAFDNGVDSRPFPTPIAPAATLQPGGTAVAVTSAPPTSVPPAQTTPLPSPTYDAALADWTVLVYMDADNNLELSGLLDLNEMEAAGNPGRVNVLVQIDRAAGETDLDGDWTDTRRYRITGDGDRQLISAEAVASLGEQNMGDPAVLADFIAWGVSSYPANRYALILWDHGAGWNGIAFDSDTAEFGLDDHISLPDLTGALQQALAQLPIEQLDVIGFDACLMGQLDVFNAIRPYARYAVGSEELTPGQGWNYETLLAHLYSNSRMDGAQLAGQMVADFLSHYTNIDPDDFVTMSAIDLAALPQLTDAVEQLGAALTNNSSFVASAVGDARSGAESFARVYPMEYERYAAVDLHHFASILARRSPDTAVVQAAEQVMAAVETAVLANGKGRGFKNSRGVAIYFPRTAEFYSDAYTAVTQLPGWDDFLNRYHGDAPAGLQAPALYLNSALDGVIGVQKPAFVEMQVVGRDIQNVAIKATLNEADGRQRLLEYDNLIPEPTILPDGTEVVEWRDGVHDDFFIWDTEVTYLYDREGTGDFVVMWPTEPGSTLFTVQGQFRRADEADYVDANLVFDHRTARLAGVWAVQSNNSYAPAEIQPQAGDEFQIYMLYSDADGALTRDPGPRLFFDDERQLYFEWRPLSAGSYTFGMEAENIGGDTAVATLDFAVDNSHIQPGLEAYLDPYLGFRFLYPTDWFAPRYQDGLLYTTDPDGQTQLLVTIYPNVGSEVTAETLKAQTLAEFGPVALLYEQERVLGGMSALETAYGYTDANGADHSGLFYTFVGNDGTGFVVDMDGLASNEAAVVDTAVALANSWQFLNVGVGLQPGKWASVDLGSFSVAQPANFTYQQAGEWQRFNAGADTFVALRTEASTRPMADVVEALVRDAGAGLADFSAADPLAFPLNSSIWTRVDFSYTNSSGTQIWGFIMAREVAGQEVVAWAEAPSGSYNQLEQDVFLTMIADMTLPVERETAR